jgi:hypothetical protein
MVNIVSRETFYGRDCKKGQNNYSQNDWHRINYFDYNHFDKKRIILKMRKYER